MLSQAARGNHQALRRRSSFVKVVRGTRYICITRKSMTRPTEFRHVADYGCFLYSAAFSHVRLLRVCQQDTKAVRTSCLQQSQLTATWRVKTGDHSPSLQHMGYLQISCRHLAGAAARVWTGMCVDSHERANNMV